MKDTLTILKCHLSHYLLVWIDKKQTGMISVRLKCLHVKNVYYCFSSTEIVLLKYMHLHYNQS